jgi:hypothetical protein
LRKVAVRIFDRGDQPTYVHHALRSHKAILRQVAAQTVHQLRALPHQEIPAPEHHARSLLLDALHRHEPHRGPLGRLADCLGVSRVVLLPLHEELHVGGWNQADGVPQLHQLAAPVVRAGARLHGHDASRLGRKERKQPRTTELLAEHNRARCISAVRLENRLGDIKTYGANVSHGRLL